MSKIFNPLLPYGFDEVGEEASDVTTTGSAAAGQVAYWDTSTSITGSTENTYTPGIVGDTDETVATLSKTVSNILTDVGASIKLKTNTLTVSGSATYTANDGFMDWTTVRNTLLYSQDIDNSAGLIASVQYKAQVNAISSSGASTLKGTGDTLVEFIGQENNAYPTAITIPEDGDSPFMRVFGSTNVATAQFMNESLGSPYVQYVGTYGAAYYGGGSLPNLAIGGSFLATDGLEAYGVRAQGDTAAVQAIGHILPASNNAYTLGDSSLRMAKLWSVDADFSGRLNLPTSGSAAGVMIGGDALLYRDVADRLRTPDNLRVDGNIGIGTDPSAVFQTALALTKNGTLQSGVSSLISATSAVTANADGTSNYRALTFALTVGGGNFITDAIAVNAEIFHQSTANLNTSTGQLGQFRHQAVSVAGTVTGMKGSQLITNTGSLNNGYGFLAQIQFSNTGNNTTYRGLYVVAPSKTSTGGITGSASGTYVENMGNIGTATNAYGHYIVAQSGATNNYAIYIADSSGTARSGITWNGDTNIYRSAANQLATDDALKVGASTTTLASLNMPNGVAPTSPVNGDVWQDGTHMYARINGATYQLDNVSSNAPIEVTGTSQAAAVNTRYITNNAGLVTVTLPATAAQGDQVLIRGKGIGGWKLAQNASQVVHGASDTTVGAGGSLASQTRYDCVTVECITANTDWLIINQRGTLTIV